MFTQQEVERQLDKTREAIENAFDEIFPVEGDKKTLKVENLEIENLDIVMDIEKHTEKKMKEQSVTVPVRATFKLVDNVTNEIIDEKKTRIIRLPVMTPRGSFVVDGNEYQGTHQLRLKAGVYTKQAQNGDIRSQVNIENMQPFKVELNPESGIFTMKVGTSNVGMYAFLKGIGVTDSHIKKFIGEDLLDRNRRDNGHKTDRALKVFADKMTYTQTDNIKEARQKVKDFFSESKMSPETTEETLGEGFENVNTDMILHTAKKLLAVTKGEEEEDDRDSLAFKKIMGVEDLLEETIKESAKKIKRSFEYNTDRHDEIKKIVSPKDFNKPIKKFFTTSDLMTAQEITNPLNAIGNHNKVTIMGEGGITSPQAITDEMININPSTLGFLDPVHTPESGKIGANLHLASMAQKEGQDITTEVIDYDTKEIVKITPREVEKATVAFPDNYDREKGEFKTDEVKTLSKKEIKKVPPSEVDYVLVSTKEIFDVTTNMIPFLENTQGNRSMMGGKMQEQAISLKERERPLVQSGINENKSFEQGLGETNAIKSPVDGTVTSTDPLTVKDSNGKKHKLQTYKDYPLGGGGMINHEIKVEEGDEVKEGDLLADNNFTDQGELALGKNLSVAFIPYKGYTFEDGLVISENAAKKMSSEHLYTESIKDNKGIILDKDKFKKYYPNELDPENARKLDSKGVAKQGVILEKGDIVIAALEDKEVSEADVLLNTIKNDLALDKRNASIYWDKDAEGKVTRVMKHRNLVKVVIKTEEPAKVGDKIVGRHGNKGTVSKVIPDEEMPRRDGKDEPLDVILNPHTVPSRMNPSQLLETAAGKIAEETGEPYIVNNFEDEEKQLEKIRKKMDELGIEEKETIVDPKEGEIENPIFTGNIYMLKLKHQTKKKFSARGTHEGYDMDGQPLRGGKNSGQALDVLTNYSLLAHGAKANLKEMATIKGQKNDEFWRAFQNGEPLPKPKENETFNKFKHYLEGLGVKIEQDRDHYQLMAMTDEDIEDMSNGAIEDAKAIKAKNLDEYKGGIFDPEATGGKEGDQWAHIDLKEPMPNPVFEKPIKTLLGLTNKEYKAILSGKEKVNGKFGGRAIKEMLSEIDIGEELSSLKDKLDDAPKSKIDDIHKKIRYLDALDRTDKNPEDYVISKMPVIPPKFRPVYELPNGSLGISDVNELYRHVLMVNDAIERDEKTGLLDDEDIGKEYNELYDSLRAMQGVSDPITYDARQRGRKGILKTIGGTGGTQPKDAFFQSKVVKRRQDLSGRSTIVAGPERDIDEIGLPKDMAWKVYKPHIMKELSKMGIPPGEARNEHYEKQSKTAEKVLNKVADETPVILNRAPSLHKFSTMAFKPNLIDGKSIELPSLVVHGFNADYSNSPAA